MVGLLDKPELMEISSVPRHEQVVLWIKGAIEGFFAIGSVDETDTIHLEDGSYDLNKAEGWCLLPEPPDE